MEIEVVSRKDNPLLGRIEIQFKISHGKDRTPTRDDIRNELATMVNSKKDRVVIDHMNSVFGKAETVGYAKIYEKKETAQKIERKHTLKRNKLFDEKKKEEKKQDAKAESSPEKA